MTPNLREAIWCPIDDDARRQELMDAGFRPAKAQFERVLHHHTYSVLMVREIEDKINAVSRG